MLGKVDRTITCSCAGSIPKSCAAERADANTAVAKEVMLSYLQGNGVSLPVLLYVPNLVYARAP